MNDAVGATSGMAAKENLLQHLIDELRPLKSVAVAFSGGVDSSVVVAAAARSLGSENVLAVTAKSETLPEQELLAATELACSLNIPHSIIETHELDNDEFRANSFDRCYHCKTELWLKLGALAKSRGISSLADGVNADDTRDYRPGIRASDEAGVFHPLELVGAGKTEVRAPGAVAGPSKLGQAGPGLSLLPVSLWQYHLSRGATACGKSRGISSQTGGLSSCASGIMVTWPVSKCLPICWAVWSLREIGK